MLWNNRKCMDIKELALLSSNNPFLLIPLGQTVAAI